MGHAIFDREIAKQYLDYWKRISKDPEQEVFRSENEKTLFESNIKTIQPLFSPRLNTKTGLGEYCKMIKEANNSVYISCPFGLGREMTDCLLGAKPDTKRFILMNMEGNNQSMVDNYNKVKDCENCWFAIGAHLEHDVDYLKQERLSGMGGEHVKYVHAKFLIVDPFSENPKVVTGSANFSNASTITNDENMVVIQDQKVAMIYLAEFMRIFNHFEIRNRLNGLNKQKGLQSLQKGWKVSIIGSCPFMPG